MKLTRENLKQMINEVLRENKQPSMILSEVTYANAKRKINEENVPFAIVSAFRSDLSYRKNMANDRMIREEILNPSGLPYTVVEGGFLETPQDAEGKPIKDADKVEVNEKTYVLFAGESKPDKPMASGASIWETARKIAELTKQEAFIFGLPLSYDTSSYSSDPEDGPDQQMYIAAYAPSAPRPGPKHKYPAEWAGPWTSFEDLESDDIYYTKFRGTKGKFVEEEIEKQLQEALSRRPSGMIDAMKKDYQVKKLKAILRGIRGE